MIKDDTTTAHGAARAIAAADGAGGMRVLVECEGALKGGAALVKQEP